MRRFFQLLGAVALFSAAVAVRAEPQPLRHVMGSDCVPRPDGKSGERGCYIIVADRIGALPAGPVWWVIQEFPDEAAALAAKTARSTIVHAFGRTFLMTVAGGDWTSLGGKLLDRIGPLPMAGAASSYTATSMEATSMPGRKTPAHIHPGPEAWFMVEGSQCLETPEGVIRASVGAPGAFVRGDIPMMLTTDGEGRRRALVLVLHPSDKEWATMDPVWRPTEVCSRKP